MISLITSKVHNARIVGMDRSEFLRTLPGLGALIVAPSIVAGDSKSDLLPGADVKKTPLEIKLPEVVEPEIKKPNDRPSIVKKISQNPMVDTEYALFFRIDQKENWLKWLSVSREAGFNNVRMKGGHGVVQSMLFFNSEQDLNAAAEIYRNSGFEISEENLYRKGDGRQIPEVKKEQN